MSRVKKTEVFFTAKSKVFEQKPTVLTHIGLQKRRFLFKCSRWSYTIGRPLVHEAEIRLENGKTFSIEVENNSLENKYVVSATMNDRPLDALTFSHRDIVRGGVLRIVMAE